MAANADPRYGEAWYRLGLTFLKLGAAGDAYRSLIRAVEARLAALKSGGTGTAALEQ